MTPRRLVTALKPVLFAFLLAASGALPATDAPQVKYPD